ncbi:MAG TPA: DUF924 domain-containing protein [Gammaproteobacteria bacterium]|nr:DUF924 domain-containing protein [Gammaproteobacteria bacterium]
MSTTPQAVLDFWYREIDHARWFNAIPELDVQIRTRFEELSRRALAGALDHWRDSAEGCLALVILLDQFPLNMYRGSATAFAGEEPSREVAAHAIAQGFDRQLADEEKIFLYMPYMHSEELADQERAIALFEGAGLVDNARWARHHRDIVARFGRFPHRNAVLGRHSTAEEEAWLQSDEGYRP